MSKRKDRLEARQLFTRVLDSTAGEDAAISAEALRASADLARVLESAETHELPRMKKFRFQLLHAWIVQHHAPCRVADIGGGKGLLAYLLTGSGSPATVIDPVHQALPTKYKDLLTDRQVHIAPSATVPHLDRCFDPEMARDFDLLHHPARPRLQPHAHRCRRHLPPPGNSPPLLHHRRTAHSRSRRPLAPVRRRLCEKPRIHR